MIANTTVPITISPEAAAHVAQLGMQEQFQQMLKHTLQALAPVYSIDVQLDPPYEEGWGPCIVIQPLRDAQPEGKDVREWDYIGWIVTTFPPQVHEHFIISSLYR